MNKNLLSLITVPILSFQCLSAADSSAPSTASLVNYDKNAVAKYVTNVDAPKPWGPIPTKQQVDWQRLEYYAFIHFGLNTFTGREWGYGDEKPAIFNPVNFDADKAIKELKAGGMKGMIYTAKHHDGWCAWPTKTTKHNISAAPYKNGKGDIVKEFSDACAANGILFGTYLSPWDRNHAEYGREGYIRDYYAQITELLSNYGPIFEIWFDGANGGDGYYGGARERRSIGEASAYYNFDAITKLIRGIQPDCIIWGAGSKGDARWGGSEKGHVNYPHWHTIHNRDDAGDRFGSGSDKGERWVPAEGDTPINHAGWFWHAGQETRVKSPEHLLQVWFDSVGRGANLLLNVALDNKGLFEPSDLASLNEFKRLRDELYKKDYALGATITKASEVRMQKDELFGGNLLFDDEIESFWSTNDGTTTGSIEAKLAEPAVVDVVRLREQIRLGQRVRGWNFEIKVNGEWKQVAKGESIGNQVLMKFNNAEKVTDIRLNITASKACPTISEISLFRMPLILQKPRINKNGQGEVTIHTETPVTIVYTTDGSEPTATSTQYTGPITLPKGGVVKAATLVRGQLSGVAVTSFGLSKKNWKVVAEPLPAVKNAKSAIDDDPKTFWHTHPISGELAPPQSFTVDMGENYDVAGFTYLPRQDGTRHGMTSRYMFELSIDGKNFKKVAEGEFGNLRANPIEQIINFSPQKARYFRFTGTQALEKNHVSAAEIGIMVK